jgi:hypothetical protein
MVASGVATVPARLSTTDDEGPVRESRPGNQHADTGGAPIEVGRGFTRLNPDSRKVNKKGFPLSSIRGRVVARSRSGDVDPSSCTASAFLIRTLNVLELHASVLYKSSAIRTIDESSFGVSKRSIASRSVN